MSVASSSFKASIGRVHADQRTFFFRSPPPSGSMGQRTYFPPFSLILERVGCSPLPLSRDETNGRPKVLFPPPAHTFSITISSKALPSSLQSLPRQCGISSVAKTKKHVISSHAFSDKLLKTPLFSPVTTGFSSVRYSITQDQIE